MSSNRRRVKGRENLLLEFQIIANINSSLKPQNSKLQGILAMRYRTLLQLSNPLLTC
uniref:Uncharacterized protein n=1 Tax=Arundo donax TaxID=35708 RepID=A0A0A9B4K9_ARUDO